jgi:hypothetical protein
MREHEREGMLVGRDCTDRYPRGRPADAPVGRHHRAPPTPSLDAVVAAVALATQSRLVQAGRTCSSCETRYHQAHGRRTYDSSCRASSDRRCEGCLRTVLNRGRTEDETVQYLCQRALCMSQTRNISSHQYLAGKDLFVLRMLMDPHCCDRVTFLTISVMRLMGPMRTVPSDTTRGTYPDSRCGTDTP